MMLQGDPNEKRFYNHGRKTNSVAAKKEIVMSIAKVIEITCESTKSFEDAIKEGLAEASKTVHGIRAAWVKEQQVVVEDGKVNKYRVDLKVTFVVD